MIAQPSIWEQTSDTITYRIGDIIELELGCWADTGTYNTPEQLARLARVLKGDLELRRNITGKTRWFRILETRVEGGQVIGRCQAIEPLIKGAADWGNESQEEEE